MSRRVSARALLFVVASVALLQNDRTLVRAQTAAAIRSWRCVAASAQANPVFRGIVTAGCPGVPSTAWPAPTAVRRTAEAIVAPGSPSGLAAAINGATVVLTWTAPAGGAAPDSYVIEAGSSPGTSDLADFATGSAAPALTVTDVAAGRYFVRVRAQNAGGTSAPSTEIVVVVGSGCGGPPDAPTGLAAGVSGSTVALTWQAAASGCPAASFVIQAGSAPGLSNLATISTGTPATTFTATDVGAGTYYVRLRAANAAGTSAASNEVAVAVGGCSGPPNAPSGLASQVSGTTVTLSWAAAPGAPGNYRLEVGSSPGAANLGTIDNGSATAFTAANVPAGTYYVQVRATNACGAGAASNTVAVVVGSAPPTVAVTVVHAFSGPDGLAPSTAVVQAADGNFYGVSNTNGPPGSNSSMPGLVYRVTAAGAFTIVHQFTGSDGAFPLGSLFQAGDGNFYGTTSGGATSGTVFRMTPSGAIALLHGFAGGTGDGAAPQAGLIQASDGNFYGTTQSGGLRFGTLFRVTPSGAFTLLYAFTGGADGSAPRSPLLQASDGNFYGTTQLGGASNCGTLFRLTPGGAVSLVHAFTGGADGGFPVSGLIQAADGRLYGTTPASGGSSFRGGTIFRIELDGTFSLLHTFTGADGESPLAALLQASDGNFYGTTSGGVTSSGTLFAITSSGAFSVLHAFAGGVADGAAPAGPLIQASDGSLYGTTTRGGSFDLGTVFRVTR